MPKPIPPSTAHNLLHPAPPGERHYQMVDLALSLLRCGIVPEAVEIQFREMYDDDVSDEEISGVITWAGREADQLPRPRSNAATTLRRAAAPADTRSCHQRVLDHLKGFRCTENHLQEAGQLRADLTSLQQALAYITALYAPQDLVNVVTECKVQRSEKGEVKVRPSGYGKTLTRDKWLAVLNDGGVPQGIGGAWVRPNPTDGKGVADANVTRHSYLLIESDNLLPELQLAFLARLQAPVAAIVHSGGKSYHALIEINARDAVEYSDMAAVIYRLIQPYGFDPSNKNPSRMSRLPGAVRSVGQTGDGKQRLIYLRPNSTNRAPGSSTSIL